MRRPRVLVNMASSLDGKINPVVRAGEFVMSRHPIDHARMKALRGLADVVMIGAGNLRADNPDLAATGPARPLRVVVTTRGEGIQGDEAVFDRTLGETVVAHAAVMTGDVRERLSRSASLMELGDDKVDMSKLLEWLGGRGCKTVLCEGGGEINAQLFAARAVDEIYLTIVPRVLGGRLAPSVVSGDGFGQDEIPDAKLVEHELIGDELFLRYAFTWPPTR